MRGKPLVWLHSRVSSAGGSTVSGADRCVSSQLLHPRPVGSLHHSRSDQCRQDMQSVIGHPDGTRSRLTLAARGCLLLAVIAISRSLAASSSSHTAHIDSTEPPHTLGRRTLTSYSITHVCCCCCRGCGFGLASCRCCCWHWFSRWFAVLEARCVDRGAGRRGPLAAERGRAAGRFGRSGGARTRSRVAASGHRRRPTRRCHG